MTEGAGATKQPRWAARVDHTEAGPESDGTEQIPSEFRHLATGSSDQGDGSSEPT